MKNCVSPSLIPSLINYVQGRKMYVKWHGQQSKSRHLHGGWLHGGTFGILEYLSQSNKNASYAAEDKRWKCVDDLTILEIINLLTVGMSCFHVKNQVQSYMHIDKNYIFEESLITKTHLEKISEWTLNQKMKVNKKKTNYMIFNFTENFQYGTRIKMEGENIEEKYEVKLLGTVISNDLKWEENTKELVRKANARMCLLRVVSNFNPPQNDLKILYIKYVRSLLEQSCVLWHGSLTEEDREKREKRRL